MVVVDCADSAPVPPAWGGSFGDGVGGTAQPAITPRWSSEDVTGNSWELECRGSVPLHSRIPPLAFADRRAPSQHFFVLDDQEEASVCNGIRASAAKVQRAMTTAIEIVTSRLIPFGTVRTWLP